LAQLAELEQRLGHRFANPSLLAQALTHPSWGSPHNERLEFLGDGVLGCVITEELLQRFPRLDEGELSRLRAALVRRATLAQLARDLGLGAHLRLGEGEAADGGAERASNLADALEAVFGAVFLDAGYAAARAAVLHLYGDSMEALVHTPPPKDAKTRLQEYLQSRRQPLPEYRVLSTRGAAHRRTFEVECRIAPLGLRAVGTGSSRRAAEQHAAAALLKQVGQ